MKEKEKDEPTVVLRLTLVSPAHPFWLTLCHAEAGL